MLFGGFGGFPGAFGPTVAGSSSAAVPSAINLASPFPGGGGFPGGFPGGFGGVGPWGGGFPGGYPTTLLNNRFTAFPETFANVTPFGFGGFPGGI